MVSCLEYGLDGENEWQRHPYRGAAVRMIEGDLLPALVMGREEGCTLGPLCLSLPFALAVAGL